MTNYLETNRELWNGWAKLHIESAYYDVEGFKAGRESLHPLEIEEVGDVSGKTLLHLQCHFGQNTLSWARRGARVTGVDFSEDAIALARSLSQDLGIEAEFICSDIYELPAVLDRQFDIVFTSYGVLCWLPDLTRWAEIVARYLSPGGTFYIAEFHPLLTMFDDAGERLAYPYFCKPEPERWENQGSYAEPDADFSHTAYEWTHGLGEIVTALIEAGLKLEFLHEHPYSVDNFLPFLEENEPGQYVAKGYPNALPLMFSIRATR